PPAEIFFDRRDRHYNTIVGLIYFDEPTRNRYPRVIPSHVFKVVDQRSGHRPHSMKYLLRSLFVATVLTAALPQAHASFVLIVSQVGPDVVVTGSGTLNVAGLAQGSTTSGYQPQFAPSAAL